MRWLLCNPAYIAKKEVNKKKRTLDQSRLPESQRYRVVDANWLPIVSKETFDKVQLLLGENLRSGIGAQWELPGAPWRIETRVTPSVSVGIRSRRRKLDRKSTRLNSSHLVISYAVFCLT